MSILKIRDINDVSNNGTIRARVCRLWNHKSFSGDVNIKSYDGVLVDEQGDAIHATMSSDHIPHFSSILEPGKVYDISGFYVHKNKTSNIVVKHDYKLFFTPRKTRINEFRGDISTFPKHGFELIDYDQFFLRIGYDFPHLSDILARVTTVHANKRIKCLDGRDEDRRDVDLEDINNKQWTITLWGDTARTFDEHTISELHQVCIMVFTSTKLRNFNNKLGANTTTSTVMFINPDIPEAQIYYESFPGADFRPIISGRPTSGTPTADELFQQPKTTMEQFMRMDPYTITCTVDDGIEEAPLMLMGKAADALIKPSAHILAKVRNTRPDILPPQVTALINNTFVFQVSWGSRKVDSTRRDLVIGAAYKKPSRLLALQTTQAQQAYPAAIQQTPPSSLTVQCSQTMTPLSINQPTPSLKIHSDAHSHFKRKLSYKFDAGLCTTSSIHESGGATATYDSEMDPEFTVGQSKIGPHPEED